MSPAENRSGAFRRTRLFHLSTYNVAAALLAILLPAAVTAVAWQAERNQAQNEAKARFDFEATRIRDAIAGRMRDYEQVMRGAAGLFAASTSVERAEWRAYHEVLKLDQQYPGIQALGYGPLVPEAALPGFVQSVRAAGFPDFAVHPKGIRTEYTPILFIEPFSGRNLRALGFDMFSEPTRRAAMERARDSGRAAASGRVTLVQDTDRNVQPGFVLYLPVYRNGAPVTTIRERRAALQGYVYGAFRTRDFVRGILGHVPGIGLQIYDGPKPGAPALLYDSAARRTGGAGPMFTADFSVIMHERAWSLTVVSLPAFEAGIDRDKPRLVLVAGTVISVMLLMIVWTLLTLRARDLSLARRMSAEASARRAQLEAINDASPLGIFRTDAEGRCVYTNRKYEELTGLNAEQVRGDGWSQAVHPEDRARVLHGWRRVVEKRVPTAGGTHRLLRSNGKVLWVSVKAAAIQEDGQITGYTGSLEDITASYEAERALKENREQLTLALDGSNLALFDWQVTTGEVHLSERWSIILGGAPEPTVTTIQALEALVHPEDAPELRRHLYGVLKGNALRYHVEHRVKTHYGDWKWIASRAKVVERDETGRAIRVTGTNADITDRKEVERLKNEFIATVSHELRTPLTSIIGSLELLKETGAEKLSADSTTFLDMAIKNSERLAALINDVLDIEKIEAGKTEFALKPLAAADFLRHAIEVNQMYAQRFGVAFRLEPGVPDARVLADEARLLQVTTNLLSNAAKFSPHGQVVSVSAAERDGMLRVCVTDRGAGIPEAFRNRIFEKFAQADSSDSRARGGTGLGLSICKAIIERMRGLIGFESKVGHGTTFYFDLPLAPGD